MHKYYTHKANKRTKDALQSPPPMARKTRTPRPLQRWNLRHGSWYPPLRVNCHSTSPPLTPNSQLPSPTPQDHHTPKQANKEQKQAGANGAQQAGSWACRETFVAVIIGNAPMIYPLCRRIARRAGWYISTKGVSANSYPLTDSGGLNSKSTMHSSNRKRKFKHPLSLPDTQYHDEQTILPSQPTICEAGTGNWDEESRGSQEGIKIVRETIVRRE